MVIKILTTVVETSYATQNNPYLLNLKTSQVSFYRNELWDAMH